MGKRRLQQITGLTKEQRIEDAIKRKEVQKKEEDKKVAEAVKKFALLLPMVGLPRRIGLPLEKRISLEELKQLNAQIEGQEVEKDQLKLDALRKKFDVT